MKYLRLHRLIKLLSLILIPMVALSACQSKVKADDVFLQEFSENIRPKVKTLCENFDSQDALEGVYFSRYAFGIYTFIALKNDKFEILSFDDGKFSSPHEAKDVYQQKGEYSQDKENIILQTKDIHHDDALSPQVAEYEKFVYLKSTANSFLITDLEDVASSISWSKTMGSAKSQFKKIHC